MLERSHTGDALHEETHGQGAGIVQATAGVLGVAAAVLGLYGLLRSGLNTHDLGRPHDHAFGVEYTPLLALCAVAFGFLLMLAARSARAGRVLLGLACALLGGFGAALAGAAASSRLHHWFGVQRSEAWRLVAVGAVGLLVALVASGPRRIVVWTVPDTETTETRGNGYGNHWWRRTRKPEAMPERRDEPLPVS